MTNINQIAWDDTVLPFQLDRSSIRGRIARLDGVLDHILTRHDYPAPVATAVAELALLTALIGQTVKLRWKLSLQVRGNGAIRTIAADYYAPETEGEPARIRAWASFDAERLTDRRVPLLVKANPSPSASACCLISSSAITWSNLRSKATSTSIQRGSSRVALGS